MRLVPEFFYRQYEGFDSTCIMNKTSKDGNRIRGVQPFWNSLEGAWYQRNMAVFLETRGQFLINHVVERFVISVT